MSSQRVCCVPGCAVVRKDGLPLHSFPSPKTRAEMFKTWIKSIWGEIAIVLDYYTINHYSYKRVCDRHFKESHKYPSGYLSKLAIPTLYIPDLKAEPLGEEMVMSNPDITQQEQLQQSDFNKSGKEETDVVISTPALASTNTEAIISTPALASTNTEAIISTPALASTNIEAISKPALASTNIEAVSKGALASTNIEAIISKPALTSRNIKAKISKATQTGHWLPGHQNNRQPNQPQCRERKSKKITKSKSPRVTLQQNKSVLKK